MYVQFCIISRTIVNPVVLSLLNSIPVQRKMFVWLIVLFEEIVHYVINLIEVLISETISDVSC